MRKDRTITKKTGYLIADSSRYGVNQCISKDLRFTAGCDEVNEIRISEALQMAQEEGYRNIRFVTCHYIGLTIPTGVVEWIKTKEIVKPFKL